MPRYPTPAEQVQTEALNAEQASATATATVIVRANPGDPGYSAAIAQNSASQSQYDAQLKDYRDRADARLKTIRTKRAPMRGSSRCEAPAAEVVLAPSEGELVVTAPTTVILHDRLVDFDDLRDPDRELAGVPVEDRAGYLVGHFRHMTYQEGTEEAVITLRYNKTVVLDDEHLRFDPVKDVVVADLSFNELNSMSARF